MAPLGKLAIERHATARKILVGLALLLAACDSPDPPENRIVVTDPLFFQAPTGSLRYVISGYDTDLGLCVSAVWHILSFDDSLVHCDDFSESSGYVVITPGKSAGCFDYVGNTEVLSASGCVDWAEYRPGHVDIADLEFEVTSEVWSGTVIFDYRP